MEHVLPILGLAFFGSVIALVGGVVFLFNKSLCQTLEKYSVPFAAGVLITVSLVGLLPEAVEILQESAFAIVLLTFFAVYLFENVLFEVHHHGHDHHRMGLKNAAPLVIVGDTIHNFIDGVAIASTYLIAPGLGLITTLSTFLHEVPHEIGDFGILLKAGWSKRKVLMVNFLSALMTIVGAIFVIYFLEGSVVIGYLLAVSAGIFLYLGAIDFLPYVDDGSASKLKSVIPLSIGVIIMLLTLMAVPHSQ